MIFKKCANNLLLLCALALCCLALRAHAAKVAPPRGWRSVRAALSEQRAMKTTESTAAIDENAADDESDEVVAAAAPLTNEDADDDNDKDADDDDDDSKEDDYSALKSALQAGTDGSSLSVWSMVRGFWNWIKDDISESFLGDDDSAVEGRTFGKIRRMQMALIPIIFKFGILSAMVAFLVVLGMKTVFLLKVLLLLNAATLLGKFLTLKSNIGHQVEHHAPPAWNYNGWSPASSSGGWSTGHAAVAPQYPSKEIHLHIHGAQVAAAQPQVSSYTTYGNTQQHQQQGWERRSDPYAAYDPAAQEDMTELTNDLSANRPQAYPIPMNHRQR